MKKAILASLVLTFVTIPAQARIIQCEPQGRNEYAIQVRIDATNPYRLTGDFLMAYNGGTLGCASDPDFAIDHRGGIKCVGLLQYPHFEIVTVILSVIEREGKGGFSSPYLNTKLADPGERDLYCRIR